MKSTNDQGIVQRSASSCFALTARAMRGSTTLRGFFVFFCAAVVYRFVYVDISIALPLPPIDATFTFAIEGATGT